MKNKHLLGSTVDNSMAISLDQLGASGVQGELIIQAMFSNRDNDDPKRLTDQTRRNFEVKAGLSRNPPDSLELNGAFNQTHGSSFIIAQDQTVYLEVEFPTGNIRLDINERREVSMASADINASNADEARQSFLHSLSRYLDRMSFLAGIPAYITMTVIRDVTHEVQYISFLGPPRPFITGSGGEELSEEMQPIYALYREAMNSSSPYYRVLCFHKIMEGLLGPLRVSLRKRATSASLNLPRTKDVVPNHSDFPQGLKEHVGTPLKGFYDKFLSTQYRNAMAHFTLKKSVALDVSSPVYISRFIDVAFVSDICTRALIQAHELNLRLVLTAERERSNSTPN